VEWDDLKYLVAVADGGSVNAAARELKVEPHVVGNRLGALEAALHCELVAKTPDGVAITPSGLRAVEVGRAIAAQIAALTEEVGGLTGTMCVTCTAGFVSKAMQAFSGLRAKHPGLNIDVMMSSQVVDLRRKEADLAVRMFKDQQDGIAMHKLGAFGWSLYAGERYLSGRTPGANLLDGHTLIAYDSSFSNTAGGRWIAANAPATAIGLRVGGIRQAFDAAAANHGVCLVPCYLAKEHPVVRVTDQVLTTNEVYAVYLAERGTEARLRAVIDALADLFVREQATFAGTTAG
jgi:DNA-binding transcriptional LysR family regulator